MYTQAGFATRSSHFSSSFNGIALHPHWHSYHHAHTSIVIYIYMEEPRSLIPVSRAHVRPPGRSLFTVHDCSCPFMLSTPHAASLSHPSCICSYLSPSRYPRQRVIFSSSADTSHILGCATGYLSARPCTSKEVSPPDHVHAVSRTLLPCSLLYTLPKL